MEINFCDLFGAKCHYIEVHNFYCKKDKRWRFPKELKVILNFRENISDIKRMSSLLSEWTIFHQCVMHFKTFQSKLPLTGYTTGVKIIDS